MRDNIEQASAFKVRHTAPQYSILTVTLTTSYTIAADSPNILFLDGGVSARDVYLPAIVPGGGQEIRIFNTGTVDLTIRDAGGVSILVLHTAQSGEFISKSDSWASSSYQVYSARLTELANISWAQGDIVYYNGLSLVKLAAGTSGHFLKTQGPGANPLWAAASGATLSDGDYGDIVVSSSGTVMSIDSGVLTAAGRGLINSTVTADPSGNVTGINKVGIGTSSLSLAKSTIQGNINSSSAVYDTLIGLNASDGTIGYLYHSYNGSTSYLALESFNVGNTIKTPIVFQEYGGNVGIGTANPQGPLDVNGAIYLKGSRFIHNFNYGNNGTVTTAGDNTFVGRDSGNFTMGLTATHSWDASSNTCIGAYALFSNTIGFANSACGWSALFYNTTGYNNAAVGFSALFKNITGSYNTALGVNTLYDNTTGSGNIGIGFINSAGAYVPVFNPTTENDRLVMGHTGITNAYVQVAWTVVSDARDKIEIEPVQLGLDFVQKMRPVSFKFRVSRDTDEAHGRKRYGFLAQEVLALEGSDPVIIDDEDPDKLKYCGESLVPVLVRAIQELQAQIDELKGKLK